MRDRRPQLLCSVLAVVVGLGFLGLFTWFFGYDEGDLVLYESRAYGVDLPEWYGEHPWLLTWTKGDGQAFVTLAADPWAEGPGREFTPALYRYSRAGYSWAGRVAALFRVEWIPVGLLVVNLGSLAWLGWMAGSRLRDWGPRALVLVAIPAALVATASSTSEALACALAAGTVLSAGGGRSAISAALLGIVRPELSTTFLLLGRSGIWPLGATAATAIGIRIFGLAALGMPWAATDDTLTAPLAGYLEVIPGQHPVAQAISLGILAVALLTVLRAFTERQLWTRVALVATALLALSLAPKVLSDPMNSLRAVGGLSLVWAPPSGRQPSAASRRAANSASVPT